MIQEELYMRRALELAKNGLGYVSPNPMVGCVIVSNGKIIGEGWHQMFGGPHAEVNAINSVKDKSQLSQSTLYVTLEPCAHYGKTPPCADLIVQHNLKRVVICNTDPFPEVAGKGIEKLKKAGIEVKVGMLEEEGLWLNRRFFTSIDNNRPYVILKWAQTQDGYVARENFDSKWISNARSRQLVHKWRTEEDAILVGFNTAIYDNPQLNCRDWNGGNPLRLVLDKNLELPDDLALMDKRIPTICFNQKLNEEQENLKFVQIDFEHPVESLLKYLNTIQVRSLIVEGGSATLSGFIQSGLWDEARVFESSSTFDKGIAAPAMPVVPVEVNELSGDVLKFYVRD